MNQRPRISEVAFVVVLLTSAVVSAVSVEALPAAVSLVPISVVVGAINACAVWAAIGYGHNLRRQASMAGLTAILWLVFAVGILLPFVLFGEVRSEVLLIVACSAAYVGTLYAVAQVPFLVARKSCGVRLKPIEQATASSTVLRYRLLDVFAQLSVMAMALAALRWTASTIAPESRLRFAATLATLHVVCILFIAPAGLRIAFLNRASAVFVNLCWTMITAWILSVAALAVERAIFEDKLSCRGWLVAGSQSLTLLAVICCTFGFVRGRGIQLTSQR